LAGDKGCRASRTNRRSITRDRPAGATATPRAHRGFRSSSPVPFYRE
jgi:hypothetical protein